MPIWVCRMDGYKYVGSSMHDCTDLADLPTLKVVGAGRLRRTAIFNLNLQPSRVTSLLLLFAPVLGIPSQSNCLSFPSSFTLPPCMILLLTACSWIACILPVKLDQSIRIGRRRRMGQTGRAGRISRIGLCQLGGGSCRRFFSSSLHLWLGCLRRFDLLPVGLLCLVFQQQLELSVKQRNTLGVKDTSPPRLFFRSFYSPSLFHTTPIPRPILRQLASY